MEAALIVFIIFGSITIWVRGFPAFLDAARGGRSSRKLQRLIDAKTAELRVLEKKSAKYEERLQTLEAIVCDVDYELNRKLARLATQQLMLSAGDSAGSAMGALEAGRAGRSRLPSAAPARRKDPAAAMRERDSADASLAPTGIRRAGDRPGPSDTGSLRRGMRVADRFVIEGALGAGAMGEVYTAHDETLDETVALKVMAGVSLLDPDAVERFRREATAARRITHPNVVRLHDIGVDRGVHFISMEYVRGESLRQRLARDGALPLAQVRNILAQLCDALEAAHGAGVVHRDLKPDNVLIDHGGDVRVIDFGVARLPYREGLTATGVVMGTPEYMAPEQIQGKDVDGRTDLYAAACIAFHMIAGSPPFKGDSPIAVGIAHCTETVPSLEDFRDVPAAWEVFIDRGLAKDPDERFTDAAEMRGALPPA
ncbi:MAG: serine/threonine protein kinase [Myxococcales bacterium]|nr:serine/threonine protein kinase [Myxococcales bacterium]